MKAESTPKALAGLGDLPASGSLEGRLFGCFTASNGRRLPYMLDASSYDVIDEREHEDGTIIRSIDLCLSMKHHVEPWRLFGAYVFEIEDMDMGDLSSPEDGITDQDEPLED